MRRALRWSRSALFLLLLSVSAWAQDQPPLAVLLTAPEFGRGIDALPANVIPNWRATYSMSVDGTSVPVTVRYITEPLDAALGWPTAACRVRTLRQYGTSTFYYEDRSGWSLLVTVGAPRPGPESLESSSSPAQADSTSVPVASSVDMGAGSTSVPTPCTFVDMFVIRFQFFLGATTSVPAASPTQPGLSGPVPEFPAILSASP